MERHSFEFSATSPLMVEHIRMAVVRGCGCMASVEPTSTPNTYRLYATGQDRRLTQVQAIRIEGWLRGYTAALEATRKVFGF